MTGAAKDRMGTPQEPWLQALRVLLVTDGSGDPDRIDAFVRAAIDGGIRAVQLREPRLSARQLVDLCHRLRPRLDAAGVWLYVNDRVDVVATGHAHGAQIGHRSLRPADARSVLVDGLLGVSVHDEDELAAAVPSCDFALLAPVWPTASKPDLPGLGVARAGAMTAAARLPVLWLGGVDARRIASLRDLPPEQRPVGVAAMRSICVANDPGAAAAELVAAWAALSS